MMKRSREMNWRVGAREKASREREKKRQQREREKRESFEFFASGVESSRRKKRFVVPTSLLFRDESPYFVLYVFEIRERQRE